MESSWEMWQVPFQKNRKPGSSWPQKNTPFVRSEAPNSSDCCVSLSHVSCQVQRRPLWLQTIKRFRQIPSVQSTSKITLCKRSGVKWMKVSGVKLGPCQHFAGIGPIPEQNSGWSTGSYLALPISLLLSRLRKRSACTIFVFCPHNLPYQEKHTYLVAWRVNAWRYFIMHFATIKHALLFGSIW